MKVLNFSVIQICKINHCCLKMSFFLLSFPFNNLCIWGMAEFLNLLVKALFTWKHSEMMPSSSTLPPCIVFSVASGLPAILLSICNFYHLINFNFPFTKTFLIVFIKSLQHSIDLDRQDATSNISRDHCQFTFAHLSLINQVLEEQEKALIV